jgi:hypothetical protein
MSAGIGGRYVQEDDASVILSIEEASEGALRGTLSGPGGMTLAIRAKRQGQGYAGTIGEGEDSLPFTVSPRDGGALVLDMDGDETVFRRAGDTAAKPAPGAAGKAGKRNVVINGRRWSDEDLARAEAAYAIRIPDADYWYDRVLGAWGVKGSPTLGFLLPGLDLGDVAPDASGGGTWVFVNGRELHPTDLAALQLITGPIPPGRYFITAQGLAGYEGGPPQWNLLAMAMQAAGGGGGTGGGGGGGGSTSWQSRLSSGISDGETIGIFLPNGGIVSTGP